MPFTFFKSPALRKGRAAIIRAAITGPIPGTLRSSFSVAVLTSILPNSGFSFACDFLPSDGLIVAVEGLGTGVAKVLENPFAGGAVRGRAFPSAAKRL